FYWVALRRGNSQKFLDCARNDRMETAGRAKSSRLRGASLYQSASRSIPQSELATGRIRPTGGPGWRFTRNDRMETAGRGGSPNRPGKSEPDWRGQSPLRRDDRAAISPRHCHVERSRDISFYWVSMLCGNS